MRSTLVFITLLILSSCANRIPPSGGPKDEDPPELISSVPENYTLNFTDNIILLEFNEPITVQDLKNELLITPTYSGEYDYKQSKYGVTLEFEDPFEDSTTYTLNFRESIKDITEGNPAKSLRIAFSTWDYLDSLKIEGNVRDLFSEKASEGFAVGIYDVNDTITPFNGPPLYFDITDKDGNYSIQNVKSGEYHLYTFNDLNNNLTIDSRAEEYGFAASPIQLDSSYAGQDLISSYLNLTDLQLISTRQVGKYYEARVTKYLTDYNVSLLDSSSYQDTLYHHLRERNHIIRFYDTSPIQDSLGVILQMQDSAFNSISDTIYIRFEETVRPPDDLSMTGSAEIISEKQNLEINFGFNKPMSKIVYDSIEVELDSAVFYQIDPTNFSFSENRREITYKADIGSHPYFAQEEITARPQLRYGKGSFISIENDSSSADDLTIDIKKQRNYGTIRGSVNIPFQSFEIQLIQGEKVVRSGINSVDYVFEYVPAGKYRIRVLVDENNDGKWHPGNIHLLLPPEPVVYYQSSDGMKEINIRTNWELVDIDINMPQ